MKDNKLSIKINVPVERLFSFTITPPNSTLWLSSTIKEETNELPVKVGTIYTLTDKDGGQFTVIVNRLENNELVEWVAADNNYHCRYTYRTVDGLTSELEYCEWVDPGEIEGPFMQGTLEKLKQVLED